MTSSTRQLIAKFPIGAHLPLSNVPYDLINEKRNILKENPKNDNAQLRTRKPIGTLTKQEKQNFERATIIFLNDRFKGTQTTISKQLGHKLDQIARKTGTIARKIKKPGVFGAQLKYWKMVQLLSILPTLRGFGRMVSNHG